MTPTGLVRPGGTIVALTPLQQMTITRLRRGQEGKVPVTVTAEARGEALLAAERQSRQAGGTARMTVTVILAHLLARTLADHEALNASLLGPDTLVRYDDVNLGIAVALPDGSLTVPVVARAQELSLPELAGAVDHLVARARAGRLRLEDVRGGTFTLSSTAGVQLPVFGTPLLTEGQSGILLAGRASPRPVVDADSGELAAGWVLPLSLTFDHAVVNGVPALQFLEDFIQRLERCVVKPVGEEKERHAT